MTFSLVNDTLITNARTKIGTSSNVLVGFDLFFFFPEIPLKCGLLIEFLKKPGEFRSN